MSKWTPVVLSNSVNLSALPKRQDWMDVGFGGQCEGRTGSSRYLLCCDWHWYRRFLWGLPLEQVLNCTCSRICIYPNVHYNVYTLLISPSTCLLASSMTKAQPHIRRTEQFLNSTMLLPPQQLLATWIVKPQWGLCNYLYADNIMSSCFVSNMCICFMRLFSLSSLCSIVIPCSRSNVGKIKGVCCL